MKYERKFVNISAFRRAALLSVSRRDTARSVALLRGRKDALLSHAEMGEDIIERFLWRNLTFTSDFGKVAQYDTEIFSKEITTKLHLQSFNNALQIVLCMRQ